MKFLTYIQNPNISEFEKFNTRLETVTFEEFKEAAIEANFTEDNYITFLFNQFDKYAVKFLVKNNEGIMFNYFQTLL